jgi:hypothetical protein
MFAVLVGCFASRYILTCFEEPQPHLGRSQRVRKSAARPVSRAVVPADSRLARTVLSALETSVEIYLKGKKVQVVMRLVFSRKGCESHSSLPIV